MQLNITFRQFGSSDALKAYAREKVERVNRLLDRAGEAHVVLSLERHLHHADITIHSGAWVLRGRDKSEDMYASIDLAMDKIERQLRRYKDKLKDHGRERLPSRRELAEQLTQVRHAIFELPEEQELAGEETPVEAAPEQASKGAESAAPAARMVRTSHLVVKPMTVDEAVMQMNLMDNDFYVFTNVESGAMSIVYRRKDGQYGLIEPQTAEASASAAAAP